MLVVQIGGGLLFAAAVVYLLLALVGALRFRLDPPGRGFRPAVTVMLPCCGAPPRLAECLRSLCDQDYDGPFQVVFGLHSADDPAAAVIAQVLAGFPGLDATVVADPRKIGSHPKTNNLNNMMAAVKHDLIAVVDSDVIVERNFLAAIVAPFADPKVGATTCIYKGAAQPDFASRLGACYINDWFIPSALVDMTVHGLTLTYGAAAAVRRAALEQVGGFPAMATLVSQDYAMGNLVRRAGWRIALAQSVVATVVAEAGLSGLYRHEVRWMRSIRATRPLDHALWISSSALVPLAVLSPAWPLPVAAGALGTYCALRLALHLLLRRRILLPPVEPLMLPVREVANFALWTGSLMGKRVHWGNQVMSVEGGKLSE
ncbi:MAG: bacteriohopanetetrol glucosamine biosynthesis glycosyltransferase HpnI [Actinomycetota bacterium]